MTKTLLLIIKLSVIVTTQTIFSNCIFHGLLTFPDHDGKKYSAIITGANGITGAHMVRVLAESPQHWEAMYASSRKPPNTEVAPSVKNLAIDFLTSPDEIARILKKNNVKA